MMLFFLRERMRIFETPVTYRNVSRALNKRYRNMRTFIRFFNYRLHEDSFAEFAGNTL